MLAVIGDMVTRNGLDSGLLLDLGANIGNHTVFFSRYFQHIYAFEPNPFVYRILKANCEMLGNATAFNVGLGAERAMLKLNKIGRAHV